MAKKLVTKQSETQEDVNIPLRLPKALDDRIEDARTATGIRSKQEIMRLSMERGLPILIAQLTSSIAQEQSHMAT